ncbi:polyketide synthase, partial [Bacillus wiedmannii]
KPNPEIDLDNSPFYINTELAEWSGNYPRRAGVSSFGMGGTNAHLIVEEAPEMSLSSDSRSHQLLVLSAKTETALENVTDRLVNHLQNNPSVNLADVAYTLQNGRRGFSYRRTVVCENSEDAIQVLKSRDARRLLSGETVARTKPSVALMFPGLGEHYVDMAKDLYCHEPVFCKAFDECVLLIQEQMGWDLKDIIFTSESTRNKQSGLNLEHMLYGRLESQDETNKRERLNETRFAQPALFVVEYALAKLWESWGISSEIMVGYSIGEYVVACLAGVMSLKDALYVVSKRAELIQSLPNGAMLAVPLSEKELQNIIGPELSISAVNGPSLCVVGGPVAKVDELEKQLTDKGLVCREIQTSHAFHSTMMEPLREQVVTLFEEITLKHPNAPYISTVTGQWITNEEAINPEYWASHMCKAVRFADGIEKIAETHATILVEMGPGQTLGSLVMQQMGDENISVLPTLRHMYDYQSDTKFALTTLGKLWIEGVKINWSEFYADEKRCRVPLPTYPFERKRYWIDAPTPTAETAAEVTIQGKLDMDKWFYTPSWKRVPLNTCKNKELNQQETWILFEDETGVGTELVKKIRSQGEKVITVKKGEAYRNEGDEFTIDPKSKEQYVRMVKTWLQEGNVPKQIIHLWNSDPVLVKREDLDFEQIQQKGFYSLLYLTQALSQLHVTHQLSIWVACSEVHDVTGTEALIPEKATILGPCKVIPQEYTNITCRLLDIEVSQTVEEIEWISEKIFDEVLAEAADSIIAYRGSYRWVQSFEQIELPEIQDKPKHLREGGVYIITGGLGKIGTILAEYLAKTVKAKLVLIGRSGLPEREEWSEWFKEHGEEDIVSQRIKKVQEIEAHGGEVLVLKANVADEQEMQVAIDNVIRKFGTIHGV